MPTDSAQDGSGPKQNQQTNQPKAVIVLGAITALLVAIGAIMNGPFLVGLLPHDKPAKNEPSNAQPTTAPPPSQQAVPSASTEKPAAQAPIPAEKPDTTIQDHRGPVDTPIGPVAKPHDALSPFQILGVWSGTADITHYQLVLNVMQVSDGAVQGVFTNLECGTGTPPLNIPFDPSSTWDGSRLVAHLTYMGAAATVSVDVSGDTLVGEYTERRGDPIRLQRGLVNCPRSPLTPY